VDDDQPYVREFGLDKGTFEQARTRTNEPTRILNRESEVRVLPGALLESLQNVEKQEIPGSVPELSDTTLKASVYPSAASIAPAAASPISGST